MASNNGGGDGAGGGIAPGSDTARRLATAQLEAARGIFGDEVTDRMTSTGPAAGGGGQQSAMSPAFAQVLARGMAGGRGGRARGGGGAELSERRVLSEARALLVEP